MNTRFPETEIFSITGQVASDLGSGNAMGPLPNANLSHGGTGEFLSQFDLQGNGISIAYRTSEDGNGIRCLWSVLLQPPNTSDRGARSPVPDMLSLPPCQRLEPGEMGSFL